MTDALFLTDLADPLPPVGSAVELTGAEGRHAAVVRRIRTGERIILADGTGRGVAGLVTDVTKSGLTIEVAEQLIAEPSKRTFVAVQALAKGDRSELAIEMLTEVGISEIVPWQSSRSIVKWSGERGAKSADKWRSTVREAAKQSRRLLVPKVTESQTTKGICALIGESALTLVLHEEATTPIGEVALPESGRVMIIVGPEGGISAEELAGFTEAGAQAVSISDGVLRTSTAGVVALAALTCRLTED